MGCLCVPCIFVRFRRFASAGSFITLLKVSWSIWTARHSSLAGHVRTKPELYSSVLLRRVSGNAHSEHRPQCPGSRLQCLFKHSSTTHHRHRNHTAVSGAKYYKSEDMANMMILGTSELEVEKKRRVIYPLVREPQTAREMSRMNTNNKNQSISSTTKCNAKLR